MSCCVYFQPGRFKFNVPVLQQFQCINPVSSGWWCHGDDAFPQQLSCKVAFIKGQINVVDYCSGLGSGFCNLSRNVLRLIILNGINEYILHMVYTTPWIFKPTRDVYYGTFLFLMVWNIWFLFQGFVGQSVSSKYGCIIHFFRSRLPCRAFWCNAINLQSNQ